LEVGGHGLDLLPICRGFGIDAQRGPLVINLIEDDVNYVGPSVALAADALFGFQRRQLTSDAPASEEDQKDHRYQACGEEEYTGHGLPLPIALPSGETVIARNVKSIATTISGVAIVQKSS
jgi:hypothetical protein